jgi:hypothetical protein
LENSNGNAIWRLTAAPAPGFMLDYWEYSTDGGGTYPEGIRIFNTGFENDKAVITETVTEDRVYRAVFKPWEWLLPGSAVIVLPERSVPFAYSDARYDPFWETDTGGEAQIQFTPPTADSIRAGARAALYFDLGLPCDILAGAYGDCVLNLYAGNCMNDDTAQPFRETTIQGYGLSGGYKKNNIVTVIVKAPSLPEETGITVEITTENGPTTRKYYPLTIVLDTLKAKREAALVELQSYYQTTYGEPDTGSDKREQDALVNSEPYKKYAAVRVLLRRVYDDSVKAIDAVPVEAGESEIDDIVTAAKTDFARVANIAGLDETGLSTGLEPYPHNKVAVAAGTAAPIFGLTPVDGVAIDAVQAAFEFAAPGKWSVVSYNSTNYSSIFMTGGGYSINAAGGMAGLTVGSSPNSGICFIINNWFADKGLGTMETADRDVIRIGGLMSASLIGSDIEFNKDELIWALAALHESYGVVNDSGYGLPDVTEAQQTAYKNALAHSNGWYETDTVNKQTLAAALEALAEAFPNDNLNHYDLPQNVLDVIALIRAIGGVTPRSGDAISAAREAYDALGDGEYNGSPSKDLVSNYKTLTDAEAAYALLQSPVGEAGTVLGAALPRLKEAYDANPGLGSTGGEWAVLGVARGGLDVSATKTMYLGKLNALLAAKGLDGIADGKYTEYSRIVLALSALGVDAEAYSVSGAPYNFVPKLTDYDNVIKQGINGPIYALLALDGKPYAPPDADSRERYVQYILANIHDDGGWSLDDTKSANSDPDVTAATLQALANYKHIAGVPAAIESGLAALKAMQDATYGGFYSFGQYNSESAAQVIVALSELGIDPTDAGWTVGAGKNPVTALLAFYDSASEMFRHTLNGGADAMATEQAAYALVALDRFTRNANTLYKMSDAFGDADGRANKSGLQNAILQTEVLAERDYTGETWSALQTKLSAAQSVYANANATQDEVDTAKNELLAAIGALEYAEITVNGDVLNAAIAIGNALSTNNYTNTAAVSAALSAAQSVYANGDATQTDIDAAKDSLLTALAALARAEAIHTELLENTSSSAITAALLESDYTPETWSAYAGALAAAQTVFQSTHTQFEIDFAAQSLISGIGGLAKASGDDYTAVIALLNAVKSALTESDYTTASWSALQAATGKADLTAALNGLELETAFDYALLEESIARASDLDASRYAEDSYEALSVVLVSAQLKRAQSIYAAQYDPQGAIDADAASILIAMNELQLTRVAGQVNKILLKSLIDRSDTLQQPIYTPATWDAFSNALTSAKSVYNDGSAAQSAVDAAKDALLAAIGALETAIDKSALQGAIAEASAITNAENDYTAASWLSFESALEYANAILAKADATRTEISNALRDLNAAIAGLTKTGTGGPDNPGTPGIPEPGTSIGVTFRLIGATRASADVNLSLGTGDSEYVTWIPTTSYTLNRDATVYDLFTQAILGAGLSQIGAEDNYVKTITAPSVLGGYRLSEFTNGPYSGWMYTLNGIHPGYGLKERTLRDGDRVIWHYVNDYRHEVRDWFGDLQHPSLGDGTQYNKWLDAPDRAPTAADGGASNGTSSGGAPATEIKTDESLGGGGGTAKVDVKGEDVKTAIGTAKESNTSAVSVTVKGDANTKIADVTLPKASAKEIADSGLEFTVKSPVGDVSFGRDALNAIAARAGDTLEVIIADEGKTEAVAANNKTFSLTVRVGDAELRELGGSVAVALPYAKTADEDAELLTVYKLGTDGTYTEIRDAKYDTQAGRADFTTSETGAYFVSEWISPFDDIAKGEWYYKSVRYVYSNGLMNGTGDAAYSPETTLTRAMLVTVLAREAGVDTDGGGTWYSKAIEWGIANGVTDGADPNGAITREQFAAMLYRYAGSPRPNGGFDAYSDASDVSAWAGDAMAWAVEKGIITGRTETTLAPLGTATRAEAATLLQRYPEKAI